MSDVVIILLAGGFGYLLGSVPFGLIFTRIGGKGDIRDIGSGNIGATNVLRAGSKILALATLLADAAKGALAVALVWRLGNDQAAFFAGLAAFVGHLFPVWLNFKGGKGVAVFIGAMLIMSPMTGIVFLLTWLAMALVFRKSSLAALTALLLSLPLLAFLGEYGSLGFTLIMVGLSLWAHRENISRLRAGTEPKIGQ
ncbi:MAG: glycerol-3-phosphate 1-O-acyltransferase PlsY [Rhodobiaceae bacterium]|jgi:glycerol-3-phosphate acyltransferase PlsY|nr:glycerol-3-phosphate 1-O-acyltransferase PlsY [Rhodobiaceae bacterium]MBT5518442.1 glycerol-3-phosphate 1-O-acyltransferase PlsY [Rhodobiaceae bacterium]MBT7279958.1 glycerol-3-phosphate 1-O-acyltransferase PlsY [Rhodobiaceae bacterium]